MNTNTGASLYNTNGLPDFIPPESVTEARERIAALNVAVMSIDDQVRYREMSGSLDPEWFKKAATSKRFKSLEVQRLQDWLDDNVRGGSMSLNDAIVEIVRQDFLDADWAQVVKEAKQLMKEQGSV